MAYRRTVIALVIALAVVSLVGTVHALGTRFDRTLLVQGDPLAVAVDTATRRAFVINGLDDTVTLIDTASGDRIRGVPVGQGAIGLAVEPSAGRVFVLNNGDSSVSVLDARSGALLRTVGLGYAPELIAVDPHAGYVFVTNTTGTQITMLASATGRIVRGIPLARAPVALAVDQRLNRLLAADTQGVQLFDARSGALLGEIDPQAYPAGMDVDEQTGHAFILDGGADRLDAVDLRTKAVTFSVPIGPYPVAVAVDSRSGHVFVAGGANVYSVAGSYRIAMFSAANGTLLGSTPMDSAASALLADPANGKILADLGTSIAVLDASTGAISGLEPVPGTRVTSNGMAVDSGTGHAFAVATYQGEPGSSDPPLVAWARTWLPFLPHSSNAKMGSVQEWTIGQ